MRAGLMAGFAAAALSAVASGAFAQPLSVPAAAPFERVMVRDNIYMLSGPDGNVVIQLGPDGAIVIDSQRAAQGAALVAELKKITGPTSNVSKDVGHLVDVVAARGLGAEPLTAMSATTWDRVRAYAAERSSAAQG